MVLVSGGLDSATTLALAQQAGRECHALTVRYGQRHACELEAAAIVCRAAKVASHREVAVDLAAIGGSALTCDIPVPKDGARDGIPVTYVPARNTLFLSLALALAEVLGAHEIWIGANAIDYSGYPDCRPEFLAAFEGMAALATKAGISGRGVRVLAPLLDKRKAEIIRAGLDLGVDFGATRSCYDPDKAGRACGLCDACRIRLEGFRQAGVADPAPYAP